MLIITFIPKWLPMLQWHAKCAKLSPQAFLIFKYFENNISMNKAIRSPTLYLKFLLGDKVIVIKVAIHIL